ncbi:MAG: hypothetical protein AB1Z22_06885, partial [Synechococcaceae cyanobacterium]
GHPRTPPGVLGVSAAAGRGRPRGRAGAAGVRPWHQSPTALPLIPAGQQGQDRLRLAFTIDAGCQLQVDVTDLLSGERRGPIRLGSVR